MPIKIAIFFGALLLTINLAAATKRHALVIGNADYGIKSLTNPINDARDMNATLTALGFEVKLLLDEDLPTMLSSLIEFGKRLEDDSVGLFYFAGHGMQAYNHLSGKDSNFLLPVDFAMSNETQLPFDSLDVRRVISAMSGSRSGGTNIIILDACRDNPYERSFRGGSRGLTQMASSDGMIIAYATAPGDVADDGKERNGLFTKHLLAAMQQPDQLVELAFKNVAKAVRLESSGKQVPFFTSSLTDDFYFKFVEPERLVTITLRSNVYGDQVYINGNYVGSTKLVTELAAGWHEIEVRKDGYKNYSARLLLDSNQILMARLQPNSTSVPTSKTTPKLTTRQSLNYIDGLSLSDWLLFQQGKSATIASLDKIMAYERQHGGNAASRSYINKGLRVVLAEVDSADKLIQYQLKFGHLPDAPAQIKTRLGELLAAGTSREELIRLRAQFPASETLRLRLATEYHQAGLFDNAETEYQRWLDLTDSSHPKRKHVLESMVAARMEILPPQRAEIPRAVSKSRLIKLIGSNYSDYTKIDAYGYELSRSAKSWTCVIDNRSGLIWEVKTDDDSIRDKDNEYRWGGKGVREVSLKSVNRSPANTYPESRRNRKGNRYADWNKLVDAVNSERLCGFSDWRVPDLYELASLVRCHGGRYLNLDEGCKGNYQEPTIFRDYFPNAQSRGYWSASPSADDISYAWQINFNYGSDGSNGRSHKSHVRLVRSSQ